MTNRYYRLAPSAAEKVRIIENYGAVWLIDHFFLPREELPYWLQDDPELDLAKLDLRFKATPKSKKIPQMMKSAGKLYMNAAIYDNHFAGFVQDSVTPMSLLISGEAHYFLRPDVVIDCLDEKRSKWRQRRDGYRYSWPSLVLKNVPENAPALFRPGPSPEFWSHPVFSEQFVETCKKNKVIGAVFEEVYPLAADARND